MTPLTLLSPLPRIRGYRISPGYTAMTLWTFDGITHRLISTRTSRPNKGLSRHQRYWVFAGVLEDEGLVAPAYLERGSP